MMARKASTMINSANITNTQSLNPAVVMHMLDKDICERIVGTIFECTQLHRTIWYQRTYRVSSTVCRKKVLQMSVNQGVTVCHKKVLL